MLLFFFNRIKIRLCLKISSTLLVVVGTWQDAVVHLKFVCLVGGCGFVTAIFSEA